LRNRGPKPTRPARIFGPGLRVGVPPFLCVTLLFAGAAFAQEKVAEQFRAYVGKGPITLSAKCRDRFREFDRETNAALFAVTADGSECFYSRCEFDCGTWSEPRYVLQLCEKHSGKSCRIYATGMHSDYISPRNSIVWDMSAKTGAETGPPSGFASANDSARGENARGPVAGTRSGPLSKAPSAKTENAQVGTLPTRRVNRHGVAVIIGNKNYRGRTPAVDFALNDADAMRRHVIERMGFRPGNIIDLRDTTRAEIATVFGSRDTHKGRLFNWVRAGVSDVVVFYSGHGVPGLRNGRGYLLPVDADPNFAEIGGYPVDLLYANLAKIPARSVTVFLDACFSGDSPKGMLIRATSGLSVTPINVTAGPEFTVLTAASGDQFASWDEEARHGLFTKHLLEALDGAADDGLHGNGDGQVTLGEIKRYLDSEMSYQARRRYGREQTAHVQGRAGTVLASLHAVDDAAPADSAMAVELAFWNSIENASDPEMFEAYLRRYPRGAFADIARLKIRNLASPGPRRGAAR
jgi:hypothetical protein